MKQEEDSNQLVLVSMAESAGLQQLMTECQLWSDATFGVATPQAKLHHLKKEVVELIEALDNKAGVGEICEEFADCLLLLVDAFSHFNGLGSVTNAAEYLGYSYHKLIKNKNRKWSPPDENGVCQHIETDEEKVAKIKKNLDLYESEY